MNFIGESSDIFPILLANQPQEDIVPVQQNPIHNPPRTIRIRGRNGRRGDIPMDVSRRDGPDRIVGDHHNVHFNSHHNQLRTVLVNSILGRRTSDTNNYQIIQPSTEPRQNGTRNTSRSSSVDSNR